MLVDVSGFVSVHNGDTVVAGVVLLPSPVHARAYDIKTRNEKMTIVAGGRNRFKPTDILQQYLTDQLQQQSRRTVTLLRLAVTRTASGRQWCSRYGRYRDGNDRRCYDARYRTYYWTGCSIDQQPLFDFRSKNKALLTTVNTYNFVDRIEREALAKREW